MKKVIVVAAALLASSAHATSGLDFGDLNYFLKSGQFNLKSNLNVENIETQDKQSGTSFETNGYVLKNTFGYGIADNLNAFIGVDYAFRYTTEVPGSSNSDNGGMSNPSLGANYRLLNQSDSFVNVDFGAVASFKVMDAKRGMGGGADGNFTGNSHTLELNTRVGRKWNEANEFQFGAGAIQNFSGGYTVKTGTSDDIDTKASTDFYLQAAYQYRPVQEFMMSLTGRATHVGEVKGENSANANVTDNKHLDFNFIFSAKYLITETFIFRFNYSLNHLDEYNRRTGAVTSEQKNRFENYYGVGLDWLF